MKVFARFMKKVNVTDGCWPWMAGVTHGGYGQFGIGGRGSQMKHRAHRLAWIFFVGPIPAGLWVLHSCDNPPCCRPGPGHLFLGTPADNMADMWQKGRGPAGDKNGSHTHPECVLRGDKHPMRLRPWLAARGDRNGAWTHPESRPRGDGNGAAKLTAEQVREIRRAAGSQREVAALFGVAQATVWAIRSGKLWEHVR